MSDITINNASFTQAYRKYPVEQGHDPVQAAMKSTEATDQAASVKQLSEAISVDTVVISPAAQQAYVEQNLRTHTVNRRSGATAAGKAQERGVNGPPDGGDTVRPTRD